MSFNPLKEKGIPLDKQIRIWDDIISRPYKKDLINTHSRSRQILMNGIEVECWGFLHHILRTTDCTDTKKLLSDMSRIENQQQLTMSFLAPANQTVLDTTLAYEQVAVNLTAWLAQNEEDDYVKETFDFGLSEDFDHLYRYAQFAKIIEDSNPDDILKCAADVMFARPTQFHHNENRMRLRKPYDKKSASIKTKLNILTLMSAEQQTHNFYSEHGYMYPNLDLRSLYAEIKDVEEEHTSMYESLIDPAETILEKLLLREFMEVCTYHNCYVDEDEPKLKQIYEEFLAMELEHLQITAKLIEKKEGIDPVEIIGDKVFDPCHFEVQKDYVSKIAKDEINKRLCGGENMSYLNIDELPENWGGHKVQAKVSMEGAPSEKAVRLSFISFNSDVVSKNSALIHNRECTLKNGLDKLSMAPNTVTSEEYQKTDTKSLI